MVRQRTFVPFYRFAFVSILLFALTIVPAAARQSTEEPITEIETTLNRLVDAELFSGAVLIARDGEILLSKGYGLADREWDIANIPQSKFRIASISKQFTAIAILMLQEQGKLTVDDKVCQYIEACPDAWQDITLRHLLMHTSGIPDFDFVNNPVQQTTVAKLIDSFRALPLRFPPGEGWNYTNSGYVLLGYVIEQVSGSNYRSFLNDTIFKPLGMNDTGYDSYNALLKYRTTGYSNPHTRANYIDASKLFAAGGLYSTVSDLYLWEQVLFNGEIVSMETSEAALKNGADTGGSPEGDMYSYGLFIGEMSGQPFMGHGGWIPGYFSFMAYFPDDKITIIVLSNLETSDSVLITQIALETLLGES
jgi:CubicO group peptidase (beta-lactamase class C family)